MSRPPEKFMMRKHPELQKEINEMMLAIIVHHIALAKDADKGAIDRAIAITYKPTWEQVVELLDRAYKALDEQKYNPIKY